MTDDRLDRREFAKRLAIGTTALPFVAATDPPPAVAAPPTPPANPDAANAAEAAARADRDAGRPQADLLLEVIRARYPDPRLTPSVLASIRGDVDFDLHRGRQMAEHPLANSDEPAPVFAAWRSDPLA